MDRCRSGRSNPEARWIAGIWLASILAACEPSGTTPEIRAKNFIEALVTSSAETEQLRDIANLASERQPEELLDGLSARIGLNYLRTIQAQGGSLKFVLGEIHRLDVARRTVKVHVAYLQPGAPAMSEVRFLVNLEARDPNTWRIVRVTGDN